VTLNVTLLFEDPSNSHTLGTIACINCDVFARESETARGLYSFNCFVESGGLFKVTGSHVHCKSGYISETVQDRDVFLLQITNMK